MASWIVLLTEWLTDSLMQLLKEIWANLAQRIEQWRGEQAVLTLDTLSTLLSVDGPWRGAATACA